MKIKLVLLISALLASYSLQAMQIKVGVRAYYPPFAMIIDEKKQITGFDVELITEICKRIKADCTLTSLQLYDLFQQVQDGTIGLAIGALIITEERQQNFLFSLPYLTSYGQFVTAANGKYNTITEVCTNTVGIIKGSIYKYIALNQCKNAVKISEFADTQDAYLALANQNIAAFLTDEIGAKYWASNDNSFKLTGTPIPTGTGYAILANVNESDLIKQINQAMLSMENDGTYTALYEKYF